MSMKSFGRLIWIAVALGLPSMVAAAEDLDLAGMWHGQYHYPDSEDGISKFIGFTMLVLQQGDDISGVISESNTFGEQSAPHLHATFKGHFDPNTRELVFTKSYDGTGKISHDVQYRGLISEDGNSGSGKWQVSDDWGGTFQLNRIPKTSGGVFGGLWTGTYKYPNGVNREPVRFSLYLVQKDTRIAGFMREANTFGAGDDPWLYATITGKASMETGDISFIKTYDGTGGIWHDVEYTGHFDDAGNSVLGRWEISSDWGSEFSLRKPAPIVPQ